VLIIAGKMSDCPSYLGITINDRLQAEELIKYDLLVFCPSQFHVTFWLPNWGQRSTKTFDVQLRDSHRTHVVFLTHLLLDPVAERSTLATLTQVNDSDDRELLTLLAAIAGAALTFILLVTTLCFRLRSTCVSGKPSSAAVSGAGRKHGRRCRVCAYVTIRVVYSIVVSFATVVLTLSILVQPDVEVLSSVEGRLSAVSSDASMDEVDRAAGDETLRHVRDARARHSACTQYVNQLYSIVLELVRVRYNRSQCAVGSGSGAMERLESAVKQYASTTQSAVDDYGQRVSAAISLVTSVQTRHLANLYNSDWSNFMFAMFNSSDHRHISARRLQSLPDDVAATLSRPEVDFASFVGVDVIPETKAWLDQFWRRLVA